MGNKGGNNRESIGETSITISIGVGTSKKDLGISLTLLTSITSSVMDISLGLRRTVIGHITCSIVNIRFSYRVDQTSVKSIVSQGEPSIWESIRISTQAIPVRKNNRGSCILRSRGTKCYTNKGDKSLNNCRITISLLLSAGQNIFTRCQCSFIGTISTPKLKGPYHEQLFTC